MELRAAVTHGWRSFALRAGGLRAVRCAAALWCQRGQDVEDALKTSHVVLGSTAFPYSSFNFEMCFLKSSCISLFGLPCPRASLTAPHPHPGPESSGLGRELWPVTVPALADLLGSATADGSYTVKPHRCTRGIGQPVPVRFAVPCDWEMREPVPVVSLFLVTPPAPVRRQSLRVPGRACLSPLSPAPAHLPLCRQSLTRVTTYLPSR